MSLGQKTAVTQLCDKLGIVPVIFCFRSGNGFHFCGMPQPEAVHKIADGVMVKAPAPGRFHDKLFRSWDRLNELADCVPVIVEFFLFN